MSELRKSFLKGYLVTLITEGELQGARSVVDAATRATKIFAKDSLSILGEFAEGVAKQKFQQASAAVASKIEGIARNVSESLRTGNFAGLRNIVDDMAATYERGLDVLTQPKR